MRRIRPILLVAVLGTLACGGNADPAQDPTGDVGTGDSAADFQAGPCASIVDCAAEIDRPVTRLIAQYGEGGTCWAEFPTEACWQDCRAILSATACAMTDACCECETAADCAYDLERPFCAAGSCAAEPAAETDVGGTDTDVGGSDTDVGGSDTDPSGSDTDTSPDLGEVMFEPTEFLVLLSLAGASETPIQLVGSVASQDGMLSLDLEYLDLEVGSTTTPRTPNGQFLTVDVPVAEDGSFEFALEDTSVAGTANPIGGADVVMSIAVTGQVGADRICGALRGSVTVPAELDLDGSSFSGIPTGRDELPPAASATCD